MAKKMIFPLMFGLGLKLEIVSVQAIVERQ